MGNNAVFTRKLLANSIRPTNRFHPDYNEKDYTVPECLKKPHQKYMVDGEIVPSVTAVLHMQGKEELVKWANSIGKLGMDSTIEAEKAGIIGSAFHTYIESKFCNSKNESLILGEEFQEIMECCNTSMRSKVQNTIDSFNKWYRKNDSFTVLESELSLVSEKFGYGGTIDCVCKWKEYICVLDYKTSKDFYSNHFTQLAAYHKLLKENTDYNIDLAIILRLDKNKGNTAKMMTYPVEDLRLHFKLFRKMLSAYKASIEVENLWESKRKN